MSRLGQTLDDGAWVVDCGVVRADRSQREPGPFAGWPVLAIIAAKAALSLMVSGRYGWHRDELYYAVAGLHLQGGYVEFPPVTALVAALARGLFGLSLVGLRAFTVFGAAGTVLVSAFVARDLGGTRRVQILAAFLVAFAPGSLATNWLFQPVAFDQLTTIVVLWLALRLALGRGSWLLLGTAAGVGLETKYTIAVVLVLLAATFLIWRRDVCRTWGFPIAVAVAVVLLAPNLFWEAGHGWVSVHFFLNPPPSGSDETRLQFVITLVLLAAVAVPVAVAGAVSLVRDGALRPLGWTVAGTVVAYFVLGGKSYYALPVVLFALAAGSLPLDRWLTPRRLWVTIGAFVCVDLLFLPILLPVLPLKTANRLGVIQARGDYQSEIGWPEYVRQVEQEAQGSDVILASNYGEAGALLLFGHDLPPVGSPVVTMRYWRPHVTGNQALVIGYTRRAADFCAAYRLVATISTPSGSDERSEPIARCTLRGTLPVLWPEMVAATQ